MNDLIYHYTSLNTLYNIIESQSFWLTDMRSSMDINEMIYAENLIKKVGKEVLEQEDTSLIPAYNFYALSFIKNADSYFHFSCYADNCKGVAIGINSNFIDSLYNDDNINEIIGYHLYFTDVSYDPDTQNKMINNYIKNHYLNGTDSSFKNDQILCDAYNNFLPKIKRPEFELEQEKRLVYRQDFKGVKTKAIKSRSVNFSLDDFLESVGFEKTSAGDNERTHLKYACFGNRIRSYYAFSLKPFELNNVIKSITLGPNSTQNIDTLKNYLDFHNISANIEKSKIQLRN